jgi:hypothetical protein
MKKTIFLTLCALLIASAAVFGQVKFGLDTYSHYVWRGVDFSAQSLQPSITYSTGGLSVGAWASYSTVGGYSENDLWASYAIGPVTVYYTDYYIPSATTQGFFNYNNDGGAHVLEGGLGYTGPEAFPISLAGYVNFLNDPDHSIYVQASYPVSVDSATSLSIFVGGTPTKSVYYVTSSANIINVGLTVSKTIKITEHFSLPVNALYIVNPTLEKTYLLFGFSL